ncbi:acyl-CoA dehydrogenase family protein [Microtetraspora sp. NBRC 16547]|uniref:acyl-CoA dehydrogenase family protein n=1 Tax=Microtetraspora sp. NBRC 16547 TaxID=3030993 RepID=UPI0024A46EA0|nr:acyl-CoA dehydrogenase family protein [Microtetraspora sp. NBRC 16547]GLX02671.1 acyl-CoA dehydrogenase [Microtetraspora sp. NBRC 16547]
MSEAEKLADYRARARAWLEANMEPLGPTAKSRFSFAEDDDFTPERLAEQQALQRKVYDAGYAGISWPAEYGGQGLPKAYERAFEQEAAHFVMPNLGIAGGTTMGVCGRTILAHGSPELLRTHIPRVLSGEELIVQLFSDPEAGSDLAGVRTQAVRDGDRWVLNGSKIWTSGAYYANYGMCLVRTNWDVPKHRGLTWFLVPLDAPGVTVQRIKQINGNAEFCTEFFDDVELTDADIIGELDNGWTVAQTMLMFERGGGGEAAAMSSPDPRDIAPDLRELAAAVGRLDDPQARRLITTAHVDDVVRHHLSRRLVGLMRSDSRQAGALASYGKLASGVYDPIRANLALEIADGGASTWQHGDSPGAHAATDLLNCRFMAIAGGTVEMQRNSIGERVLGLPREPSFDSERPFREVVRAAMNWSGKVG